VVEDVVLEAPFFHPPLLAGHISPELVPSIQSPVPLHMTGGRGRHFGLDFVVPPEDTWLTFSSIRPGEIVRPGFFLGNIEDKSAIGSGMAQALLTTLYGVLIAHLIALPISDGQRAEEEKGVVGKAAVRKARILVIEDEEEVRKLLTDILLSGGKHEVEGAADGSEGIELFKGKEFDLVFTDLGMPGMSGWQVAEEIKRINGKVPVVIVTGWNVEGEQGDLKARGVDLIAYKPFEVKQVLQLVQDGMALKDRYQAA